MASWTTTCDGTQGSHYVMTLTATLNSQSIANNTSNITIVTTVRSDSDSYGNYGYYNPCTMNINHNTDTDVENVLTDYRNRAINTLQSWTGDYPHSPDGTFARNLDSVFSSTSSTLSGGSIINVTLTLPTIPRYAVITAFSLAVPNVIGRLTANWSADSTCDAVQYSLNGGAWTSATYGASFNIDGLTNGTQYSVKIRVKRTDSQLWTESSEVNGTPSAAIIRLNVGGTWKQGVPYINVGGVWKQATMAYENISGTWKEGK